MIYFSECRCCRDQIPHYIYEPDFNTGLLHESRTCPSHLAKLGEITGKTRVLHSELGEITGKTRVLPCGFVIIFTADGKQPIIMSMQDRHNNKKHILKTKKCLCKIE